MKVELVDHDPLWQAKAEAIASAFVRVVGANILVVHHIGSTSIPLIKAKPVIDLLPEVANLAEFDSMQQVVESAGYEWRGEFGLPGRRYCILSDSETEVRVANIHCYERGNDEITRHLAFRDYLRAHPELAREYEAEKLRCARLYHDDIAGYCDAKDAWIKRVEREAVMWVRSRGAASDGAPTV